jgi:sugar diacid utilization regulator
MSEEVKVETVTTEQTQVEATPEAEVQKTEAKQEKSFTQEDVNKIVTERLERERSALAKALGAEQFDKEQIATAFKTAQEQLEVEKQAKAELEQRLTAKEQEALTLSYGIRPDKVDEAITLAKLKADKEEITLQEALETVASEYTNLTSVKVRGGIEVVDKTTPKNPYLTDTVVKRFPHLAKYKK